MRVKTKMDAMPTLRSSYTRGRRCASSLPCARRSSPAWEAIEYGAWMAARLAWRIFLLVAACSQVQASDAPKQCGSYFSLLNGNAALDTFDREQGGHDRRLQFRLRGREPCRENKCRLEIFRKVLPVDGIDKVVASIDLSHRDVTYCLYVLKRIKFQPRADIDPNVRQLCPDTYLLNSFGIELTDPRGPFSRQDLSIEYLYHPRNVDVDLDRCEVSNPEDSLARRRVWTVPFEDGASVRIGETDTPRKRISPEFLDEYLKEPFALTVYDARSE